MKHLSLRAANTIYLCGSQCQLHYQSVSYPPLYQLFTAMSRLEREVGDEAHNEYWQALLKEIKHYRFVLGAAPLPVNWSGQRMLSFLHRETKRCSYLYPHFVAHLEEIIALLHALSALDDNPLLDAILPLMQGNAGSSVVLLVNGIHLRTFVDEVLATMPPGRKVELVNIYQLRGAACYQRLIVIGPCRWYPEYILRAPRAQSVHFVRYSWMKDVWKPRPFFQATFHRQSLVEDNKAQGKDEAMREHRLIQAETIPQEIELPPIEWGQLSAEMLQRTSSEHDQEEVRARLCLLADGHAILLDISEHAKAPTLDLGEEDPEEEEHELQPVKYVSMAGIQPGVFLLVRTNGGGDYLIPVADQLLGEQATRMRAMQEEWKMRLRAHVAAKSLFEVSLELIDHGSHLANETNLRHWMSDRSIRPHEYRDFLAIMRLVGLEADAEAYWNTAQRIETAHRRAGFHIRKLLLAHIDHSDLSDLHKTGRMDFELSEMGASSLSAFRIEHISPEIFIIPASRVGRLYSTRKLSWLE